MKELVVRSTLPSDLLAMQNIEKRCYRQSDVYPHLPKVTSKQEHYTALVAVEGMRIVAHAVFRRLEKRFTILSVGVLPERRRKGIGKALLAGVIEQAKLEECEVRMSINEREDETLYWVRGCHLGFKSVLDGVTVLFTYEAPQAAAVCG
jgi:GNAT superfamily N-acetyltransferase